MHTREISNALKHFAVNFLQKSMSSGDVWKCLRSYKASSAIWDHSVAWHSTQANASRINPSQTARYSIYLPL